MSVNKTDLTLILITMPFHKAVGIFPEQAWSLQHREKSQVQTVVDPT